MKKSFLWLMTFLTCVLVSCNTSSNIEKYIDIMAKATPERFSTGEVREYKGINLDPAIGPRDNSIAGIQQVDISTYTLEVTGLVENDLSFKYEEVLAYPAYEKLITLYCVEGWKATILWKGVRLMDILAEAKVKTGGEIVIFYCVDGYSTSIPLKEVMEKDMLLAYSSNGIPLSEPMGYPFIVLAEDKLGYKWARWVNKIELSDNINYKGTWENNGYDNSAEIPNAWKED